LVRKEGEANAYFSSTRKGALAFFGRARFGQVHSALVLPLCSESDHHDLIFGELAFFEKESPKSYAKRLRLDFSAVLKFTGQQ